jgi:hypothetical protein
MEMLHNFDGSRALVTESRALEHVPRMVMVILYCEQLCEYLNFI